MSLLILKKDLVLKETEYGFVTYKLKNQARELLQAYGLLTGRGILEYMCKQAARELMTPNMKHPVDVTKLLEILGTHISNGTEASIKYHHHAITLLNIMKKCGITDSVSAIELYKQLSSDVHGFKWSYAAVRVYSVGITDTCSCVLKDIPEALGLQVQFTDEPIDNLLDEEATEAV